jgi:hypothetical protein
MFCKQIWTGLYILPYGDVRICSLSNNLGTDRNPRGKNGEILNILEHDISEIVNGDRLKRIRKLNIDDPKAWPLDCTCCQAREEATDGDPNHSNTSHRVFINRMVRSDVSEANYTQKSQDGTVTWLPNSLDIRFGNQCNQKCLTCNPKFSNQWYDDWEALYGKVEISEGRVIPIVKQDDKWKRPKELDWHKSPEWWSKFEELSAALTRIYITGGEPMLTQSHDEMLDRLIASGRAGGIVLEYDTNGTVINKKLLDRWKHFRHVEVRVSMDATGAAYELIRYGGLWDPFVENVQRLREFARTQTNVRLHSLTSCFGAATAFLMKEADDFAKSVDVWFHIRFLESPKHHSVAYWPNDVKDELKAFYNCDTFRKRDVVVAWLERSKNHPQDTSHMHELVRTLDILDKTRNTDWRSVLPSTAAIVDRYVPRLS